MNDKLIKFNQARYIPVVLLMLILSVLVLDVTAQITSTIFISSVAWSPDGSQIAVGYGTSRCDTDHPEYYDIQILNPLNNQIVKTLSGSECTITSVDWNADGTILVASSGDNVGVRVWNIANDALLATAQYGGQGVSSAKLSHNGLQLAVGTVGNVVVILDPFTGSILNNGLIGGTSIDWSPDSSKLVSGNVYENLVHVVDVASGDELLTLEANSPASVAWSPNGSMLASNVNINDTPAIQVWDAISGSPMLTLQGHTSSIYEVQWSPDSNFLASASRDGTVRVWDVSAATEIANIPYPGYAKAVAWSPDGSQLAYGGTRTDGQNAELIVVPAPFSCNNPNPTTDTAALISEIAAGNNAAATYSICLEYSSYTLTQVDNSSNGDNGLPVITGDITIIGNGATITRDGAAADFRFFKVDASGSLTLENVTLSNGSRFGLVAIYNQGKVELNNSSCEGLLLCYLNFNQPK